MAGAESGRKALRRPLFGGPGMATGEAALDRWSWVHLASGAGLGVVGFSWYWAIGILVGFEGVEALLRRLRRSEKGLFQHESWANVIADVIVGGAGYLAALVIRWRVLDLLR